MSTAVQIIANDITLDLYKDFDKQFWVSLLIHDLRDLETRNASYTKSFKIPATANNVSALGAELSVFNIPNQSGIKKIPCTVLMDGITILSEGDLIINAVIGMYIDLEMELLWGNYDFFESIKSVNINELNYSDLDMTWDLTGIAGIGRTTEGITWCKDEWTNYNDLQEIGLSMPTFVRTYKDIRMDGFWIYTKEVLNRIVLNAGFTMDDSLVSWDRWDKAAIACPTHKWIEIDPKPNPYTGSISKSTNTTQTDTDLVIIIAFNGTVVDPDNQWSVVNDQWDIDTGIEPTRTIVFTATLNVIHTQKNPNGVPYVAIRLNGINVFTHNFLGDTTAVITLEAELIVSTGDLVDCVGFMPNGTGSNGSSITTLATATTFVMNEIAGIDPDDTLEVDKYIPEMTASKFVTSICNMANVIIYVTEATKTVRLISFDQLINSEQQVSIQRGIFYLHLC